MDREELPEERLERLQRERRAAAAPVEILIEAHWTVSALWDAMRTRQPDLAPRVVDAHNVGVTVAVDYLNEHAAYGVVGARYLAAVDGLTATLTHHDHTGHLHSHLLVAQTVTVKDRGRRLEAVLEPGALKRQVGPRQGPLAAPDLVVPGRRRSDCFGARPCHRVR
ncbi:hypothetical protein AB0I28_32085 [Phytomonospora sp. NPDC050363]|uniref:hypothetical protein n=1 Tax=Phytomonospora sp. NPDC050363 TaxID=3155642 RepID=UPI0034081960